MTGVNHDQFSQFSCFRPDSSAAILQMVVIWPQIVLLVVLGVQIGPGPRGECRQVVFVVELWSFEGDWMGVNQDQFSHFSRLCPGSSAAIF